MSWSLLLGTLFFALGVPIAITAAIFSVRARKLRQAQDEARTLLAPVVASLGADERVTVDVRAGRKENERYYSNGRGPLYATVRVSVDLSGLTLPLLLRPQHRLILARTREKLGLLKDVEVGSAAFDAAWVVETDPALAKAVLTPEMTKRLDALLSSLPDLAKIEVGPTGLAIEWTGMTIGKDSFFGLRGLDAAWTTPDPATSVERARDALLDLRARILTYVEDRALEGVGGGSFRARDPVRVEPEPVRVRVDDEVVEVGGEDDAGRRHS